MTAHDAATTIEDAITEAWDRISDVITTYNDRELDEAMDRIYHIADEYRRLARIEGNAPSPTNCAYSMRTYFDRDEHSTY